MVCVFVVFSCIFSSIHEEQSTGKAGRRSIETLLTLLSCQRRVLTSPRESW